MNFKHLHLLFLLIGFGSLHSQTVTINTFDAAEHFGGSTVTESFLFPSDISGFDTILMHIALTCPSGMACDPWDRFANLKVVTDHGDIEIGRYMTPYANNWCTWSLDVSAYRSYFTDSVTLKSHIETWENGWAVTVDFEFIPGTPLYQYSQAENLWVDYELIYGDTLFYSIDLPEKTRLITSNAEKVIYRVNNTGHGQGNTENAAEFSQKTHEIQVNGNTEFTHYIWKDDCNVNPCSPQGGTWEFARAGWCPGQAVPSFDNDITSLVTAGSNATFDYVLEPFFNQCSPWNPSCTNGVTCASCTYNSNTHTRPNYKIAIQLLQFSNSEFPEIVGMAKNPKSVHTAWPNPTSGKVHVSIDHLQGNIPTVSVYTVDGSKIKQFKQSRDPLKFTIGLEHQQPGIYFILLEYGGQTTNSKILLIR